MDPPDETRRPKMNYQRSKSSTAALPFCDDRIGNFGFAVLLSFPNWSHNFLPQRWLALSCRLKAANYFTVPCDFEGLTMFDFVKNRAGLVMELLGCYAAHAQKVSQAWCHHKCFFVMEPISSGAVI